MDTREKALSSGLEGNAADYATFLQKIMDGTYVVGDYLNYDPCRPIRVTSTSMRWIRRLGRCKRCNAMWARVT